MPAIYGNAPAGDHPAAFTHAFEATYPRSKRFLFAFVVLNDELTAPRQDKLGNDLFAVAVCNVSDGDNPKSKPFKIRRAMLEADEYDPIATATKVPTWDHFQKPKPDGTRRTLKIRVDQPASEKGHVSLVTYIRRPRDGQWECIEGKFEGTAAKGLQFRWINPDGSCAPLRGKNAKEWVNSHEELHMWMAWGDATEEKLSRWIAANGRLVDLTPEAFGELNLGDQALYRIARLQRGMDPFNW